MSTHANNRDIGETSGFGPSESGSDGFLFLGMSSWAKPESDDLFRIGVTDIFTLTAGDTASLQLPELDDRVQQGGQVARLRTTGARSQWVLSPLGGTIVEINPAVIERAQHVDDDPYGLGWLAVVRPGDVEKEARNLRERLVRII